MEWPTQSCFSDESEPNENELKKDETLEKVHQQMTKQNLKSVGCVFRIKLSSQVGNKLQGTNGKQLFLTNVTWKC